ncbi:MAG: Crp/Fnr family transcriptional regulator [Bacteroidia bacterium]
MRTLQTLNQYVIVKAKPLNIMPEQEKKECYQCVSRCRSIFSDLNLDETRMLDSNKSCTVFKKGQVIFEEGTYPHGLYCINKGKVKVAKTGADGKEKIVHMAKDGDVMGYRAILGGDKYSLTATALETSTLCYIPLKVFTGMVEKNAKLAFKVIHLFTDELRAAETTITDLAQKTVKERLAQGILLLKESYGYEDDGCTINVTITREEIASIVGTARETATRLLGELSKEKSIELKGKRIKILNPQKLVQEANLID